jgi:hypothetical protein
MWKKHSRNLEKLKASIEGIQGTSDNLEQLTQWRIGKVHWRIGMAPILNVDCNLYKKLYMKYYQNGQEEKMNYLQHKLAVAFHDCLEKELHKVLIEKCNKWA